MKTKLSLAVLMVITLNCLPARGQDTGYPAWEALAGASGASIQTGSGQVLLGGYQVSVTNHRWLTPVGHDSGLYRSLGLKFDFGAQNGRGAATVGGPLDAIHVRQYLVGPQFTFGGRKAAASLHTLFGVSTLNRNGSGGVDNETGLSVGVGGTFDVNFTKRIALRLPQVEYIPTRFQSGWTKNARAAIGVVFKLGRQEK